MVQVRVYCGKCPSCAVHLQLGLKDKRRDSQRLFKHNVLSFLLEITVAPLAYIYRV